MTQPSTEKYFVQSVKNAMRILRLFTKKRDEISLTNIAEQIQAPKSTTHRIISSLVVEGFLSKNPNSGKYRLGLTVLTLGGVVFIHREMYQEALPIVKNLVDEVNETAHICLMENTEIVYLFRKESGEKNRLITSIGSQNPIHCTSEGLCILAFQDDKTIGQVLSTSMQPYTEKTLTTRFEILQELEKIRRQGYAVSTEQFYEGFVGIAAPIRDYTQNVISSIAIIGLTTTITKDRYSEYIDSVVEASKEISKKLGYYT